MRRQAAGGLHNMARALAQALFCILLFTGTGLAAPYQGLEPGRATRAQVEGVLGAPVAAVRPTLLKYPGRSQGIREVFVDYHPSGVAERFDVYFTTPVERPAVLRALRIQTSGEIADRRGNSLSEYFGAHGIVLTYATADHTKGVSAVGYYIPAVVSRRVAELQRGGFTGAQVSAPASAATSGFPSTPSSTTAQPCANANGSDNCTFNSGTTLDYFGSPSAAACQSACAGDARCVAWSFVKPGGYNPGNPSVCYRVAVMGNIVQHGCCVSGWKVGPAAATATTTQPTRPTYAVSMEPGVDRPGSDYRSFEIAAANPEYCRSACQSEAQCRAYTYVNPGVQGPNARCWLKSTVPAGTPRGCCVSGVKGG